MWHVSNQGECVSDFMLGQAGADINVVDVWDCGITGEKVRIGVIEKSVFPIIHPDLMNNFLDGYNFIDDNEDVSITSLPEVNNSRHAANMSGIIAAEGNNNIGAAGVAYNSKIMPVVTYFGSAFRAFQYLCEPSREISVINCSWGWMGNPSSAIENDINLCRTLGRDGKGIVITAGAGNEGMAIDNFFPAYLDDVIGVIASTPNDLRKSLSDGWNSNFPIPWGSNIGSNYDVAAPGVSITTTDLFPGSSLDNVPSCFSSFEIADEYSSYSGGTSSATAVVSGAAALVLSNDPELEASEVQSLLENNADKVGPYNYEAAGPGKSIEMGYGRINVKASIGDCITSTSEENLSIELEISPNPVTSSFELRFVQPNSSRCLIEVLDASGKKIKSVKSTRFQAPNRLVVERVNMDGYPKGLYVVTVNTGIVTESMRIILQ